MGNVSSRIESDSRQYPFVGREKTIESILKDINGTEKLVVQIHGMLEIGTSRLLTQILKKCHPDKKKNCILMESNGVYDETINGMLVQLCRKLDLKEALEPQKLKEPSASVTKVIDKVVKQIENLEEETLLFVDDVHKVQNDKFKCCFLDFVDRICKSQTNKFKVIFTISEKVELTSKAFSSVKVGKMGPEIQELFVSVIKEKGMYDEEVQDFDVDDDNYDNTEESLASIILSEGNKRFIDVLVKLCEGLPKVAIMLGSELTANDGLLEPKDMIVLMVKDFVNTLSPDCYPDLDKADRYQGPLKNLKERRELIEAFNKKMGTDNTASINDVWEPSKGSMAETKQSTRKVLENNVMEFNFRKKKFLMPSIFRDCALAMKPLLTEEDEHTKSVLRQGRLQLAKLPGAPEGIADDPRKLEEFLNSMEENDNDDSMDHKQMNCPVQPNGEPTKKTEATYFQLPYSEEKLLNNLIRKEICSICHKPFTMQDNYVESVNIDTCMCSKKVSEKNTNSGYDSMGGPHAIGPVIFGQHDGDRDVASLNNFNEICNGGEHGLLAMKIQSFNIGGENRGAKSPFVSPDKASILYSGKEMKDEDGMADPGVEGEKEEDFVQDDQPAAVALTNGIGTKTEGGITGKPAMFPEVQKPGNESQVQKSQGEVDLPLNLGGERKDGIDMKPVKGSTLENAFELANGDSDVPGFGKLGNKPGFVSPDRSHPRSLNDSD